jgi:hypothetical protein
VPQYISCLPEFDPWGNAYDFRLDPDLLGAQVTAIRSAARDSTYEADVYPLGAFPADEFGRDLVWADGFSAVFPDENHEVVFADGFEFGLWGVWYVSSSTP